MSSNSVSNLFQSFIHKAFSSESSFWSELFFLNHPSDRNFPFQTVTFWIGRRFPILSCRSYLNFINIFLLLLILLLYSSFFFRSTRINFLSNTLLSWSPKQRLDCNAACDFSQFHWASSFSRNVELFWLGKTDSICLLSNELLKYKCTVLLQCICTVLSTGPYTAALTANVQHHQHGRHIFSTVIGWYSTDFVCHSQ